jgi:hypothetical protein
VIDTTVLATVSDPDRVEVEVLGLTVYETEPSPVPEVPLLIVSQLNPSDAVHVHPACVSTDALKVPPAPDTFVLEVGVTV